jgi:type IV fimbrial biogenesis protein FimT
MKTNTKRAAPGAGWTLMEALTALAVLALVLAMASPSMGQLRARQRLQGVAQQLQDVLVWARSEALMRQLRVGVCASADGQRCDPSGRWEQGWLVFEDRTANGWREPQEVVLQTFQADAARYLIRGNTLVAAMVSFTPLGRSQLPSGAFQAGTIRICDRISGEGWKVVVNALGKPRLERDAAAECRNLSG